MRRNTVTRMQLKHKRRFESLNNNDKRNAVAKFFGISPSEVSISTVSGYDGPVTEAVIDGNTFWVLTEDEAYREATESFFNTGLRGYDIERDSYLNMAARDCPFDLDRVAEYYCDYMEDVDDEGDERSYDEVREDEYELEQWADSRFSIEDLWDNDLIDKVQFCHNIWDMDGVGMELDSEQRTESIDANGETIYIVLRDGEWLDPKEESNKRNGKMKNEEWKTQMKHDALVDAIDDSDKALDSLTEAMKSLSNAIIKATDYWGGDEIMALRKVHGKLNPLYRELKGAVNDLEKEVKGSVIKSR